MTVSETSLESRETLSERSLLLMGGFLLVIITWLFWDFLQRQVLFAVNQQADWGHTLVIPFISGYFVWLNREELTREPFRSSWTGLFLLVAGMSWYSFCALGPQVLKHHNLMGAGFGLSLIGLTLFLFGWRSMKWLWFPLLYMILFSQTISDRFLQIVTFRLQDIAAHGSYWGLTLLGYDMTKSGNTLRIFLDGEVIPVNIAEACSGMRMVVAFLALGVAMAYRGLDHAWQRCLLVAFAVPTAIFVNVLRVMTLGVLATVDSNFAAGDFHSMVGMLWLIPAFFIYLGVMWILRHLVVSDDEPEAEPGSTGGSKVDTLSIRFSRGARKAFVVACLVMVAGGVLFQLLASQLNVYLQKHPVKLRSSLANVETTIGSWKMLQEYRMPEAAAEELGTQYYISRIYRNTAEPDWPVLNLHVAYYTGQIDVVPHVPDRCLVAGGLVERSPEPTHYDLEIDRAGWTEDPIHEIDGVPFQLATARGLHEVRMPVGDIVVRTSEFLDPARPEERIFAGYFFIANGRLTPTPGGVRMLAFNPNEKYAYYCKLQFMLKGGPEFDVEDFIEVMSDSMNVFLGEIMLCLPDWADVQNGELNNPADT
ncbi:MAG: hypothetical protein CMJ36_04925 [Phycisphaerae bacterium]|nr:hypothetical protein [Phycisphaerae bacterium]